MVKIIAFLIQFADLQFTDELLHHMSSHCTAGRRKHDSRSHPNEKKGDNDEKIKNGNMQKREESIAGSPHL